MERRKTQELTNQKRIMGGGLAAAECGPRNSEGGVGAARARRPRPSWLGLLAVKTVAGEPAQPGARGVPARRKSWHYLVRRPLRDCTAR